MDLIKIFKADNYNDIRVLNKTLIVDFIPTVIQDDIKYVNNETLDLFGIPNKTDIFIKNLKITSSPNDYFKDCYFNDLPTAQINIFDGEIKTPINNFPIKLSLDEINLNLFHRPFRSNNSKISVKFENSFSIVNPNISVLQLCLNFEIYYHRSIINGF